MTSPVYTAPACTVLTVLHIVDPSAPWHTDLSGQDTTCGSGLPMRTIETWQLLEQLPGEKVCPKCLGDDEAGSEDQGLW